MKQRIKRCLTENRGRIIALAILLTLWVVSLELRACQSAADWYVTHLNAPFCWALAWLFGWLPCSGAELVWAVTIVGVLWYLVASVVRVVRAKTGRGYLILHRFLALAVVGAIWLAGFGLLFETRYATTTFEQKAGIVQQDVSVLQLQATTQYFADKLNETALLVPRGVDRVCCADKNAVLVQSTEVYNALEEMYPFLKAPHFVPKKMLFSRLMSAMDFTGFYFPLTGEANINMDQPSCLFASTVAHELAHQRLVAPEQTCNLIAILACTTSGKDAYTYSGWLLGYIHLSNALYNVNRAAWQQVSSTLCEEVNADLRANNAYWAQFNDTPVKQVSTTVYDGYLRGNGQELGMQSYGAVVDLLVAYYADETT